MSTERLLRSPVDLNALASNEYDHSAWFHGQGSHPRWLGYTLGYEMVGYWLKNAGEIDAATWINVPAAAVVEAAVNGGFVS